MKAYITKTNPYIEGATKSFQVEITTDDRLVSRNYFTTKKAAINFCESNKCSWRYINLSHRYQTVLYHSYCGEDDGRSFSRLDAAKRYCKEQVYSCDWDGAHVYDSKTQKRVFEFGDSPYHKLNKQ